MRIFITMNSFFLRLILSPNFAQKSWQLPRSAPTPTVRSMFGTTVLGTRARAESSPSEGNEIPPLKAPQIWPAPLEQLEAARAFLNETAASPSNILLVPDRDADGLSSGTILSLTLQLLLKPAAKIHTHFVSAGRSIFSPEERALMTDTCRNEEISHMIVVDQGSRASPPLVETDTKVLIIDHHQSDSFPKRATVVNACNHHPVATSSLLTYTICSPLHPDVMPKTAWLAVLGIFGDLGVRANLAPPYPEELLLAKKIYRTTHLSNLVALINAPRRTPECNTADAWKLLQHTPDTDPPPTPKRILDGEVNKELLEKLQDARARVKAEIQRCAHTPPTFSKDKRVAVVYIESRYQVHGVIATRWARSLQSNDLEVVITANGGYVDGKVNFSCRVVRERRVAEGEEGGVNIIEMLKEYAGKDPWVRDNVGADFANGHKEATGGSVRRDVWEAFVEKGLELEMRKTKSKKKE